MNAEDKNESFPLVSIIIPVYNAEKCIHQALDSVIAQTYPHWEAICVNDGSTDKSGAILDSYAVKDSRIKVLHQTNKGVSAARNNALSVSNGEFIGFIDADDWIETETLTTMVEGISKEEGIDIAIYGITIHDLSTDITTKHSPFATGSPAIVKPNAHMIRCISPSSWDKLFRKKIITKYNLNYIETMKQGEDNLFLLRYLSHVSKMFISPCTFYHYYLNNETSACGRFFTGKLDKNQYYGAFGVALTCSQMESSPAINSREWMAGLFAIQCDYWKNMREKFYLFPEIKKINGAVFKESLKKMFIYAKHPYATIILLKTLVKVLLSRFK